LTFCNAVAVYKFIFSYLIYFVCFGAGSLQTPEKSDTVQLKSSHVGKKTVSETRDADTVNLQTSSDKPQAASSTSCSQSSSSSPESDEMLIAKPQPPSALFPSKLPKPAKPPSPKVPHFLRVEGEMSADENSTNHDVESAPSISSETGSEKNRRPAVGSSRSVTRVGSDVSSEPLTFHTDFGDGCNAVASSDEERRQFEAPPADILKPEAPLLDMNENIGKKEFVSSQCEVLDSEKASACQMLHGFSDQQKVITELINDSAFLPVSSTSTVVVNMVLSTAVAQPEDQNSTSENPDAPNHSQENSECDMSMSDEASPEEAPAVATSGAAADKKSGQLETSSSVTEECRQEHAKADNKNDTADKAASFEEGTRGEQKRSESPRSSKGRSHSKSGKRDRSQSSDRKRRQSRSNERKRNRSRSGDRSGKQSGKTSVAKSPERSPQRDSSQRKDRRRSRSSSRSRRRRSSSREHRQTTSSRRHRDHSHSPSREGRRRKSRSRSRDSRRRSRSADRSRHRRRSRSRSKDRSRQSKNHKTSRDEDTDRRDDRSQRQIDPASTSSSRNRPSDVRHDSPRKQNRSPSRAERDTTDREEKVVREKPGNSNVERSLSSQHSDSDLSSAESGRPQKPHEEKENVADNNRIAVISSSSGTNQQHRHEEFESDEEPPADPPTAYDPSEPTEDNFRVSAKALDHHQMPPNWVPPANQRMPMVNMSRPLPPGFPNRLPAPSLARFQPRPHHEGILLDMKSPVIPPNHFGIRPPDGSRLPPPPILPQPRPGELQPPMAYSRPMLTTPVGALPPPPPPSVQSVRIAHRMNVDAVPLIVRGPMEPPRLVFVPPGVGHQVRLADAAPLVRLPRIICPPAQCTMADLVRLPQPPPCTVLSGPPFVSCSQMMIRQAPMVFQQVAERHAGSPQSLPHAIQNLPVNQIPRISSANQLLLPNMLDIPFPVDGGQPTLQNMPVPPAPGRLSQTQSAVALSSSSASSPSSGSQDAEDMLLERYSAKPEPPQSLFPSQKAPELPKPAADTQQKSPDQMSEESEKSSDHSQSPEVQPPKAPPQPPKLQSPKVPPPPPKVQPPKAPPLPDLETAVTTSSAVLPTSVSESLPSDPRLLVQFLLKQTRQSTVAPDKNILRSGDPTALVKPSAPSQQHPMSKKSPEFMEDSPEKTGKNSAPYSPSQADYLGENDGNLHLGDVREMKVCFCLLSFPTNFFLTSCDVSVTYLYMRRLEVTCCFQVLFCTSITGCVALTKATLQ